jgi:hypothetical protein
MEYISAASSLLHVAGVAIKTGHALYQLIYNVSEANKELEKLYYELKELTELVRQLRKLGEECLINLDPHSGILDVHNTLMQVLTQYVTDLEKLKGILGKEHPLQTLPLSNRITTWWNFSRKTKNINEMLERLERRKSAFVFVLVLLSK